MVGSLFYFGKSNLMLLCHMYIHSLLPTSLKILRFSYDPFSFLPICIGTRMYFNVCVVCMHVCMFKFLWAHVVCELREHDKCEEKMRLILSVFLNHPSSYYWERVLPLIPESEKIACLSSHCDQTLTVSMLWKLEQKVHLQNYLNLTQNIFTC